MRVNASVLCSMHLYVCVLCVAGSHAADRTEEKCDRNLLVFMYTEILVEKDPDIFFG